MLEVAQRLGKGADAMWRSEVVAIALQATHQDCIRVNGKFVF